MLRVALTGGMASGKTAAVAIFRELGCFVSQSDEVARALMQPGQAIFTEIVQTFGDDVLREDGTLDRGKLARLAFTHGRIEELNAIVHPAVIAQQNAWMHSVGDHDPSAIAVIESALVFETRHGSAAYAGAPSTDKAPAAAPWRTRFDRIVLVTAPEAMRIQRYIVRTGASDHAGRAAVEADARVRIAAQMPDEEKAALSDFVIPNLGTAADLRAAVEQVYRALRVEADDRIAEAM